MKSFYSIVYSPISAISQERINLGLLMISSQGEGIFRFSHEKLNSVKSLFSEEGLKLLKSTLASFENKFDQSSNDYLSKTAISTELLNYFSYYTNNLISFTAPKLIEVDLNEQIFTNLFEKWVFKGPKEVLKQETTPYIKRVKHNLIPRVRSRVNVDYRLEAEQYDFLVFNFNVDMIGKNDRPVLTQFVDFNASQQTLKHKITEFVSIIKPLEILENRLGKFFLVGEEPSHYTPHQHLIWEHLQESTWIKNDILELVPPNEVGKIEEYLEVHDVRPFVENQKN